MIRVRYGADGGMRSVHRTLTVPAVVGTWVGAGVGAEVVPGAGASTWYTFEPGAVTRAPGHTGGEEVVGD